MCLIAYRIVFRLRRNMINHAPSAGAWRLFFYFSFIFNYKCYM